MSPSVLGLAKGFELYQSLVGAPHSKRCFVEGYVRPLPGQRVLDLGCGTGALLEYMPAGVEYVGVDIDERYIAAARKHYGDRATFACTDGTDYLPEGGFDIALAYGVIHHLDDAHAQALLDVAAAAPRFVAAEPCRTAAARKLERWIMSHDRGRFIRDEPAYRALAERSFANVRIEPVAGTYRIPFTLAMIDCQARAAT